MTQSNDFLTVATAAARRAGQVLVECMGKVSVSKKGPRDLVTEADLASQKLIEAELMRAFPDHQFLGEEGHVSTEISNERTWVVDPLDGTTNFVHQLRSFSVSIALLENKSPIVGVVYDPLCDECFSAEKGRGAFLNGKPICVSACEEISEAMLVTGFSPNVTKDSLEARRFLEILGQARTIRRLGSAALNLCYLSCGRVDGYWAASLNAWDVAAGLLILSEGGGSLRGLDGEFDLLRPKFIATSTQQLNDEIASVLDNTN